MTDPLLTIEDATREFRVSPKTIRRRIAAGEIEGAYKRPGNRGPEWVIPRQALDAAGFVRRGEAAAVEVPADGAARADYWAQRAMDAEAALRAAASSPEPAPAPGRTPVATPERPDRRGRARTPLLVLATVAVALLAALLVGVAGDDDGDAPTAGRAATGARAVLAAVTEPGDVVGFVGPVRTDLLPPERTPLQVEGAAPDGPRYLVAVVEGQEPSEVAAVREDAEVVLELPRGTGSLLVFDTGAGERTDADPAPGELAGPTTVPEPPGTEAPAPSDPDAAPSAPAAGAPDPEGDPSPTATTPTGADEPSPTAPAGAGVDRSPTGATPGSGPDDGPSTGSPPADVDPGTDGPADPSPATPSVGPQAGAGEAGSVVVAAGASFWSIALDLVSAELGRTPTDAEVTSTWASLIAANGDRLVEPGNPDLLHVGQTLVLPAGP